MGRCTRETPGPRCWTRGRSGGRADRRWSPHRECQGFLESATTPRCPRRTWTTGAPAWRTTRAGLHPTPAGRSTQPGPLGPTQGARPLGRQRPCASRRRNRNCSCISHKCQGMHASRSPEARQAREQRKAALLALLHELIDDIQSETQVHPVSPSRSEVPASSPRGQGSAASAPPGRQSVTPQPPGAGPGAPPPASGGAPEVDNLPIKVGCVGGMLQRYQRSTIRKVGGC